MWWTAFAKAGSDHISQLLSMMENRHLMKEQNEKNAALQREFAQNSIQWKVADAKKAGIHPLAALGASTYSASPSYVSGGGPGIGDMVSTLGQGISNAFSAREAEKQAKKQEAKQDKLFELEVKQKELENAKLASEISQNFNSSLSSLGLNDSVVSGLASFGQAKGLTPAAAIPYGVDSKPLNDAAFVKNTDGSFGITYGKDVQDLMSESLFDRAAWSARNTFTADPARIARDVKELTRDLKLDTKKFKVVPLPWRPGSGRRFKVVPKSDHYDYNSLWNSIKALVYQNRE